MVSASENTIRCSPFGMPAGIFTVSDFSIRSPRYGRRKTLTGISMPASTSLDGVHAFSMVATRRSGSRSTVTSTFFSFGVATGFRNRRLNLSPHHPASDHRRRHRHLARREHGRNVNIRRPVHRDVAAHPVGHFIRILVHLLERIEQRQHHQERRPLLMHENVEVKILLLEDGSVRALSDRSFTCTGIDGASAPSSPMIPLYRSCRSAPTTSVALPNLVG